MVLKFLYPVPQNHVTADASEITNMFKVRYILQCFASPKHFRYRYSHTSLYFVCFFCAFFLFLLIDL